MKIDPVPTTPQSRTIKSAAMPRFADADKSVILIDVEFVELAHLGKIPFLACNNDAEDHGRELFARAIEGDFGVVGDFVASPLMPAPEIFVPAARA